MLGLYTPDRVLNDGPRGLGAYGSTLHFSVVGTLGLPQMAYWMTCLGASERAALHCASPHPEHVVLKSLTDNWLMAPPSCTTLCQVGVWDKAREGTWVKSDVLSSSPRNPQNNQTQTAMVPSYSEHDLNLHRKTDRDHRLLPIREAFNHPLHPTSNPGRTFLIKLKPTTASMSALADFEARLEVPKGRKQDLDQQGTYLIHLHMRNAANKHGS